jgi:hypothetical protein
MTHATMRFSLNQALRYGPGRNQSALQMRGFYPPKSAAGR